MEKYICNSVLIYFQSQRLKSGRYIFWCVSFRWSLTLLIFFFQSTIIIRENLCYSAENSSFYSVENLFFHFETYMILWKARKKLLHWEVGENTLLRKGFFFGKIKIILQFFFYDRDVYNQVLKVCKNNSQKLSTLSRAIYFMNYDQCRMITNIFILS